MHDNHMYACLERDNLPVCLPSQGGPRQSLLVSATMPSQVASMAGRVLRQGHVVVDTTGGEDEDQLNTQVGACTMCECV